MIGWLRGLDDVGRLIAGLLSMVAVLCVLTVVLSMCHARDQVRQARAEVTVATATGKALDHVATETPAIRQDQEEKQRAVDQIQGADQRLPDGFGAELERVRRHGRDHDPG